MRWLFLLASVWACCSGYVVLKEKAYIRLVDANGGYSLNASTYNRITFDSQTNLLYVTAKEPATLNVYSLSFDGTPTLVRIFYFDRDIKGPPLDVEFCRPVAAGGVPRLAVSFEDPSSSSADGLVRLYRPVSPANPQLTLIQQITVGPYPLDLEFAEDCNVLIAANKGRPTRELSATRDPEGSLSKILIPFNFNENSPITVTNIGFNALFQGPAGNEYLIGLRESNFRAGPPRDPSGDLLSTAQNIEPESVLISPNGAVAYVTLPKNNAVARVNLDTNMVNSIFPLGNRSWNTYYLDASDRDRSIYMQRYNVYSLPQAVQLGWIRKDDEQWLVSLDSGFLDEIDVYNFKDHRRAREIVQSGGFDIADSRLFEQLNNDAELGRAFVSTEDGDRPDGAIETVYLFGGRGISIRQADTFEVRTALVDNIERVSAQHFPNVFNSAPIHPSNTPQEDKEATSPSFGPNLAALATGEFNGLTVLFLAGRTSGILYVYELSPDADCPQPYFHSAHRRGSTFSSWQTLYNQQTIGDIGITDLKYVTDTDRSPILVVASAFSNSISIYNVEEAAFDIEK